MELSDCLIVLSTCSSPEEAQRIARTLVDEKLAPCVNILPSIRSIYRWQGTTETADETLMLIKATRAGYAAIEQRIQAMHSYELPEIIAIPIAVGAAGYLDWLRAPEGRT